MRNVLLILQFSLHIWTIQVQAQASPISVGPLLTCDLTTFACPTGIGCCTIAGCCGSGCCANGYTCINEGTSSEGCCPATDPYLCGTTTPSDNGSGSDTDSGDTTCTRISNCRDPTDSSSVWTCLLGQTCGVYYRSCYPCPYAGGGSDPDASSTTSSESSGSTSPPGTGSEPSSSPGNSGSYSSEINHSFITGVGSVLVALMLWV